MPAASEFARFLDWPLDRLLGQLAAVQGTLADVAGELAQARSSEVEAKAQGWQHHAGEQTVRARERGATFAAAPATATRLELEGMAEGLREEKAFLMLLVDVRLRTAVLEGAA